mgnify:CR=1 FL=1
MRKFASAVVDMLLKADPGNYAVKQRDTEGNLAIHSACEHPRPTNDVILKSPNGIFIELRRFIFRATNRNVY